LPSISLKNSTTLRQLTWFTKFPYLCRRLSLFSRNTHHSPSTRVVYIRDPLTYVFPLQLFSLSRIRFSRWNRLGVEKREGKEILSAMINLNARTWKSVLILNRFSTLCEISGKQGPLPMLPFSLLCPGTALTSRKKTQCVGDPFAYSGNWWDLCIIHADMKDTLFHRIRERCSNRR